MSTIHEVILWLSFTILMVWFFDWVHQRYFYASQLISEEAETSHSIDGKFIENRFETARVHEIVIRQMWVENEKFCDEDIIYPSLELKEIFALGMDSADNFAESAAIYFIRKGVKAHYEEMRIKEVDDLVKDVCSGEVTKEMMDTMANRSDAETIQWKIYMNPRSSKYYAECMIGFEGWPKSTPPLSINMNLSECDKVKIFESRGYFGIEMIYKGEFFRHITPHTEPELKEIFKTKLQ